jgi:ribonuclease HI
LPHVAKRVIVNVDGGSRGNPGPAAIAAVVTDPSGAMLAERAETIGEATNNVAEYRALLLGIDLAKQLGADEVEFVGDSMLIVEQVRGRWKVKQEHLRPLHAEVRDALHDLGNWSIRHVRRGDNERADELLNGALDAAE